MSQNHRHAAPAIDPTKKSSLFEVPYNLLHRHGWRKLMPRPFHPKRDLAAQNALKKTAFLML
jgi:Winged helix-turn helix